jgi:hypothetical protein
MKCCQHKIKKQSSEHNGEAWYVVLICECEHFISVYIGNDHTDVYKLEKAQFHAQQRYVLHLKEMQIRGLLL